MFITEEDLKNRLSRTGNNSKQDSGVLVEPIVEDRIFPSPAGIYKDEFDPAAGQESEIDNSAGSGMEYLPEQEAISSEELDSILDEPVDSLEVVEKRFRGRTPGATNIPDFLRPLIGASLILSGSKETDETFDLGSNKTAYLCRDGKTVNNGPVNQEHKDAVDKIVNNTVEDIKEKAAEKLMSALNLLTPEKIGKAKAGEISNVAKNMASIVDKVTPKEKDVVNPTQIIIYAPAQKSLSNYDVIPSV